MELLVKRLTSTAQLPYYAHPGDAGCDILADEEQIIPPNQRRLIRTGIAVAILPGYVGLVWDKSGLAVKSGITTLAGVIDTGYRGEVHIALYNTSAQPYQVQIGQKIAQLLIQPVTQVTITAVTELDDTSRGAGGFGSTGI